MLMLLQPRLFFVSCNLIVERWVFRGWRGGKLSDRCCCALCWPVATPVLFSAAFAFCSEVGGLAARHLRCLAAALALLVLLHLSSPFIMRASLYFRIAFMLAAIPFLPVALVKAERSPRLAAGVHAVMLKQPDWRFLHLGRVRYLRGQSNWFVAHLSLRLRIASISAIRCLIALTATSLPTLFKAKISPLSITARSSRKFDSSTRSAAKVGSSLPMFFLHTQK